MTILKLIAAILVGLFFGVGWLTLPHLDVLLWLVGKSQGGSKTLLVLELGVELSFGLNVKLVVDSSNVEQIYFYFKSFYIFMKFRLHYDDTLEMPSYLYLLGRVYTRRLSRINKRTLWCIRFRLHPHVYVFRFMHFHLAENSSKLLRPHERFCVVFACPHDNAENDGSVNLIMSGQSKPLISIVVFMLENWVQHCFQKFHRFLSTRKRGVFKSLRFQMSLLSKAFSKLLRFRWKRLHPLIVCFWTEG